MGAVVAGKRIGSKVCPGATAHPHSTTAAPTAVACRGHAVAIKIAAVNIQVNAGIAVAGFPPGRDSAAIAGGGVAGKGAVLHVQAGHLHSVGLVSGVDLNQNRATAGIVAIFYIIGGRVPVKSAAFHCVNRVEHGSFAVVVGVVHCARIPQGRVAPKGTVFQRVFLDIAVKGNRRRRAGPHSCRAGWFLSRHLPPRRWWSRPGRRSRSRWCCRQCRQRRGQRPAHRRRYRCCYR